MSELSATAEPLYGPPGVRRFDRRAEPRVGAELQQRELVQLRLPDEAHDYGVGNQSLTATLVPEPEEWRLAMKLPPMHPGSQRDVDPTRAMRPDVRRTDLVQPRTSAIGDRRSTGRF